MSDYLVNLIIRTFDPQRTIQPRLPSMFDQASSAYPGKGTEEFSDTEDFSLGKAQQTSTDEQEAEPVFSRSSSRQSGVPVIQGEEPPRGMTGEIPVVSQQMIGTPRDGPNTSVHLNPPEPTPESVEQQEPFQRAVTLSQMKDGETGRPSESSSGTTWEVVPSLRESMTFPENRQPAMNIENPSDAPVARTDPLPLAERQPEQTTSQTSSANKDIPFAPRVISRVTGRSESTEHSRSTPSPIVTSPSDPVVEGQAAPNAQPQSAPRISPSHRNPERTAQHAVDAPIERRLRGEQADADQSQRAPNARTAMASLHPALLEPPTTTPMPPSHVVAPSAASSPSSVPSSSHVVPSPVEEKQTVAPLSAKRSIEDIRVASPGQSSAFPNSHPVKGEKPQEPTVHVTIGRVEVRVVPSLRQEKSGNVREPVMSLDDYLKRRGSRGGG
jgi:hypothetical protein